MKPDVLEVSGFQLQEQPQIYVAAISGPWLLQRCTPVWRINDPVQGFQRIVRESRAREIALAVLDQHRVFPNAIVLATDRGAFELGNGTLRVPSAIKLLVVDGQHRLWAQKFSTFTADYACIIHTGLTEVAMARLFLEINDTQKRVPSSLRWDLVRLVRPVENPLNVAAADLVYQLAVEEESPLFQRIDLTGEQPEIQLKQGSIAPELRRLLGKRSPLGQYSFEQQFSVLSQYFFAIKEVDREGWRSGKSSFFEPRVLRALLRLLGDIAKGRPVDQLTAKGFLPFLSRIDAASLRPELIRGVQASAGVKLIYDQLKAQVFQGA